jgi:hypothetical protein
MKLKIFAALLFLFLINGKATTQNQCPKYIGLEIGMYFPSSEIPEKDFIRKETAPYYYEESPTENIYSSMTLGYTGIKTEYLLFENKFGITAGARYTNITSSIGYLSDKSDKDFFYILYRQDETNTEYLKIKTISETAEYIGIPLEIRCYPFKPRFFRIYYKIAADLNFLIQSKTDVVFVNDGMEIFEDAVADKFGKPNSFNSLLTGAIGFRFGKDSRPAFSCEFCFPSSIVTKNCSALVKPKFSGGFQFNFQIPLNKKNKSDEK